VCNRLVCKYELQHLKIVDVHLLMCSRAHGYSVCLHPRGNVQRVDIQQYLVRLGHTAAVSNPSHIVASKGHITYH
jgi:hypothetical protein